jgi:hypothetical protein
MSMRSERFQAFGMSKTLLTQAMSLRCLTACAHFNFASLSFTAIWVSGELFRSAGGMNTPVAVS